MLSNHGGKSPGTKRLFCRKKLKNADNLQDKMKMHCVEWKQKQMLKNNSNLQNIGSHFNITRCAVHR